MQMIVFGSEPMAVLRLPLYCTTLFQVCTHLLCTSVFFSWCIDTILAYLYSVSYLVTSPFFSNSIHSNSLLWSTIIKLQTTQITYKITRTHYDVDFQLTDFLFVVACWALTVTGKLTDIFLFRDGQTWAKNKLRVIAIMLSTNVKE